MTTKKINESTSKKLEDFIFKNRKTILCVVCVVVVAAAALCVVVGVRDSQNKKGLAAIDQIEFAYTAKAENLSETDKRLLHSFIFQIETGLPKYSIQNDTLDDLKIINDSDSNTPEELIERVCKDLECVPSSKKEAILDELLKTDVYKSISDKRDLIIERIGVYV